MKQENSFIRTLDKIDALLQRMGVQAAAVRWFYEAGNPVAANQHAQELENNSEKLTLLTRALPAYTGDPKAREAVERIMEETIPVEIGFTPEGWFSLRIPALLPKKNKGSADYIRMFLYPAMRRFFQNKPPMRFRNCVLIYRHVYDHSRPDRQRRDHDNIEINTVSDIVAMYVMPDDNPDVCSHYYCSAAGREERTEVYVVPEEDFATWLQAEEAMPDEGVKLCETRLFQSKADV